MEQDKAPVFSTVDMAQRCGALLNMLANAISTNPTLLSRTRAAFNGDSIEGTREELGTLVQQAVQEAPAVQGQLRELHAIISIFNQQVGPILNLEDRRQRFDEFKTWMGFAGAQELPH